MTRDRYEQHRKGIFRKLHYLDLTRPLPYKDCSVSAVFSSHVFEHLFMDEVESLVREIYRVLEPGGICRTLVPDLEAVVALYTRENPSPFLESMFDIGKRSAIKNSHHWGFTKQSITNLFKAAGFSHCAVTDYRCGRCPDLELVDNRPGSIFFEALK